MREINELEIGKAEARRAQADYAYFMYGINGTMCCGRLQNVSQLY